MKKESTPIKTENTNTKMKEEKILIYKRREREKLEA